jgi:hypothetical protein
MMETAKANERTTTGGPGDLFTFGSAMLTAYANASQAAARGAETLVEELTNASRAQMDDLFAVMGAVMQCHGPAELIDAQRSYWRRSSEHLVEATRRMPALMGGIVTECWAPLQAKSDEAVNQEGEAVPKRTRQSA